MPPLVFKWWENKITFSYLLLYAKNIIQKRYTNDYRTRGWKGERWELNNCVGRDIHGRILVVYIPSLYDF